MESNEIIKQETRFSVESLHDFAKWKLIVASALATVGLGLTSTSPQGKAWALLLIPYACAYVDLYSYQDLIRIIVVSQFFLESEETTLRAWERHCRRLHEQHRVWDLSQQAQFWGSFVLSLAPFVTFLELAKAKDWVWLGVAILLWMVGVGLSFWLWRHYKGRLVAATEK